jgi:hypothetical protein
MRKRALVVAGAVVAGTLAAGVWLLRLPEYARIGVGYTAQQTCACLFISGRSPASCRMDLDPLARKIVSVEVGAAEVTARSAGFARAIARYRKGMGCSLEE